MYTWQQQYEVEIVCAEGRFIELLTVAACRLAIRLVESSPCVVWASLIAKGEVTQVRRNAMNSAATRAWPSDRRPRDRGESARHYNQCSCSWPWRSSPSACEPSCRTFSAGRLTVTWIHCSQFSKCATKTRSKRPQTCSIGLYSYRQITGTWCYAWYKWRPIEWLKTVSNIHDKVISIESCRPDAHRHTPSRPTASHGRQKVESWSEKLLINRLLPGIKSHVLWIDSNELWVEF